MRLPNGNAAIVEDRKLREYVLNPAHPVGRHHAVLFERLLGINLTNPNLLKEALLEAARVASVDRETATLFGTKYELRFDLSGPMGKRRLVSVWIVDRGEGIPRLVTCFVE